MGEAPVTRGAPSRESAISEIVFYEPERRKIAKK